MNVNKYVLSIFLIVQLLGLFVGMNLITLTGQVKEIEDIGVSPFGENSYFNSLFLFGYVLFGAVALIFLIKIYKGDLIFKLMEFMVVTSASTIVFFVFILFIIGIVNSSIAMVLALLFGIMFGIIKFVKPELRNIAAVISSAGVGAIFGYSMGLLPLLFFAILLSGYDYVAVFISKHMISFAKSFSKRNLSFSIKAKSRQTKSIQVPSSDDPNVQVTKIVPKNQLELGTGDLVIPLMLVVAGFKVGGILLSLLIIIASFIGLIWVLNYVQKKKTFLPALPPLVIPSVIIIGLYYLIQHLI